MRNFTSSAQVSGRNSGFFRFLGVLVVMVVMSVSLGWGQSTYNLCTSTADLVAGSTYILASSQTAGSAVAMGYQNTSNRPQATTSVSIASSAISTTVATTAGDLAKPYEFTLGGSTGAWTMQDPLYSNYYLKASSSSNNNLVTTTGSASWTITFTTNAAVMTCTTGSFTRNILRYNSGSSLFSCYSTGQAAVYLYKKAATGSTPPALTAASNPTVDANFDVTFTDNATWRGAITAVKYGSTTLTATTDYTIASGAITLKPSGTVGGVLRTAGTQNVTVVATGYSDAIISQPIGAGAANKLAVKTQPTAPATNGAVLATQPAIYIQDQYGNTTTSTANVTAAVGAGTWTLGETTTVAASAGTATFSGLTASSSAAVNGATITFTSGVLTTATSNTFNIPVLVAAPSAPTNLTFGTASSNSFTATFSAPGSAPAGYLVLRRAGSAVNGSPVVGNEYTLGQTNINSGINEVVYVGASAWSAYAQSSLTDNTAYYYAVYAYNGSGIQTNYSSALTGTKSTATISAPITSAATNISGTGFTAVWDAVNGASEYRLDVSTNNNFYTTQTISTENFENALTLFTQTGGIYFTGNSAVGDAPASSPFAVSGTYSYGVSGGSAVLTSSDINTANHTNNQLTFRLASFSVNSAGNGADAGDIVTVEISPNGGSNYYSTVRVLGNSNATWSYSGGTGIASTAYDGDATPVNYQTGGGGNRSNDGYSTVTVTGLPSSSNLKIRITLLNDNANERWLIDNLNIFGNFSDVLSNYNNLSVSGTSQSATSLSPNTTYYYRVRAVGGNSTSVNSNTITAATTSTIPVASGEVNASTLPVCTTCDVEVASGATLTINSSKEFNSITVAPTAKLTLSDGVTLTAPITLQSSESGTATFVDSRTDETPSAINGTVEQRLPTGRNWYVGIPLDASNIPHTSLTAAGASSVSYWNESSGAWVNSYTGNLTPGLGYIAVSNAVSSSTNISFNGKLRSGALIVPVTRTLTASKPGFNLIANPYPSYLNAMTAINANALVDKTIWYRTKGTSYQFETVNTASGEGTNISNTGAVKGYVPPMQAFWVRVLLNASAPTQNVSTSLTFTNAMRYHANPTVSLVTIPTTVLKAPSNNTGENPLLRLQVSKGVESDEAVIYFNANAATGYDAYDSRKWSNANPAIPELYTIASGETLSINGLPELTHNIELPLGFYAGAESVYNIKAKELRNLGADTRVILKDGVAEYDLTNGDAYQFNSTAVNNTNRFSIIFRSAGTTTGLTGSKLNTSTSVFVNANGELVVKTSAPLSANTTVSIYNAIGQQIGLQTLTSSMSIANVARTAGVYWVKLNNDGEVVTRKVVLK